MNHIFKCPYCDSIFEVEQDLTLTTQGLVRCERCFQVLKTNSHEITPEERDAFVKSKFYAAKNNRPNTNAYTTTAQKEQPFSQFTRNVKNVDAAKIIDPFANQTSNSISQKPTISKNARLDNTKLTPTQVIAQHQINQTNLNFEELLLKDTQSLTSQAQLKSNTLQAHKEENIATNQAINDFLNNSNIKPNNTNTLVHTSLNANFDDDFSDEFLSIATTKQIPLQPQTATINTPTTLTEPQTLEQQKTQAISSATVSLSARSLDGQLNYTTPNTNTTKAAIVKKKPLIHEVYERNKNKNNRLNIFLLLILALALVIQLMYFNIYHLYTRQKTNGLSKAICSFIGCYVPNFSTKNIVIENPSVSVISQDLNFTKIQSTITNIGSQRTALPALIVKISVISGEKLVAIVQPHEYYKTSDNLPYLEPNQKITAQFTVKVPERDLLTYDIEPKYWF